jgi:4-amino-4-deoxy-L-arabinose transferase-like glycosyltransferase
MNGLNRSIAAAFSALKSPRVAGRTLMGLLAVHTVLLAYSAYVHSPTSNEPGHLVAGLSNWRFGRFDVYCVNPPLIRMVAALPVMAAGYKEDWSRFYASPGARPEFVMGEDWLLANGERSFFLFMIARWACIPFSWLGAMVCYMWARDLYGRPAGIIAASFWCFEPNILAHASLITPDAGATALGLAACYTFWRWLKQPSWSQAALTGLVLGLAELAKTTFILFYPLWPVMWLVYRWGDRRSMHLRDWLRQAGMLALRMSIGLYVVNLGYGFEGSLQPVRNYQFVSRLFTGKSPSQKVLVANPPLTRLSHSLSNAGSQTNRFAHTWLGQIPAPFPKHYLTGIDLQQRDFESYGRPSYLRGVWQDRGWWYYYLYAAAIKIPLGLWALGVFTLILGVLGRRTAKKMAASASSGERRLDALAAASLRDEFILLFPALAIFIVVSAKTGFSEHFRYVLPCFPFAFVAACGLAHHSRLSANLLDKLPCTDVIRTRRQMSRGTLAITVVSLSLMLWFIASSLWIYPHGLSYFNELVGGPLHGASHLLGSNLDWGQDDRYLIEWQSSLIDSGDAVACQTSQCCGGVAVTNAVFNRRVFTDLPVPCLVTNGRRPMYYLVSTVGRGHTSHFEYRIDSPVPSDHWRLTYTVCILRGAVR